MSSLCSSPYVEPWQDAETIRQRQILWRMMPKNRLVAPVCLVSLVHLVCFAHLVDLVQPNKRDKPKKSDGPKMPDK